MPLYNERDRDPRTRPWSDRMASDNQSVASTGSGGVVDWMGLVDLRSSLCMSVGMGSSSKGGDGGESKSEKRKKEREKRRAARLRQQQTADDNDGDGDKSKVTSSARGGNSATATTSSGGGGGAIDRYAPSPSRYDPRAMNRIVDITDLADDDSELDDSDVEVMMSTETGGGKYGLDRKVSSNNGSSNANSKQQQGGGWGNNNNNNILGRRTLVLIASVGVIMGASLGIGSIVLSKKDSNVFQQQSISLQVGRPQVQLDYNSNSNNNQGEGVEEQQNLLEIAEQIVVACSNGSSGGSEEECEELCQDRSCCFVEDDEEEGEYSCVNDESMECAVYAGCEMLAERRN